MAQCMRTTEDMMPMNKILHKVHIRLLQGVWSKRGLLKKRRFDSIRSPEIFWFVDF